MIPIYFINRNARTDRREFMEAQLRSHGIVAERISAVEPMEAATLQPRNTSQRLAAPQLACNLSHRRAWIALIESGAPAAVVMEDDVVIGPGFAALIDPSLYASLAPVIVRLETAMRGSLLGTRTLAPIPGFEAKYVVIGELGSAAYLMPRDTAIQSLRDWDVHTLTVDRYLYSSSGPHLRTRRIVQVTPAPCVQLTLYGAYGSSPIGQSDLAPTRSRSSLPKRRIVHRAISLLPWLVSDPAVFLGRRDIIRFSGDVMTLHHQDA